MGRMESWSIVADRYAGAANDDFDSHSNVMINDNDHHHGDQLPGTVARMESQSTHMTLVQAQTPPQGNAGKCNQRQYFIKSTD